MSTNFTDIRRDVSPLLFLCYVNVFTHYICRSVLVCVCLMWVWIALVLVIILSLQDQLKKDKAGFFSLIENKIITSDKLEQPFGIGILTLNTFFKDFHNNGSILKNRNEISIYTRLCSQN